MSISKERIIEEIDKLERNMPKEYIPFGVPVGILAESLAELEIRDVLWILLLELFKERKLKISTVSYSDESSYEEFVSLINPKHIPYIPVSLLSTEGNVSMIEGL